MALPFARYTICLVSRQNTRRLCDRSGVADRTVRHCSCEFAFFLIEHLARLVVVVAPYSSRICEAFHCLHLWVCVVSRSIESERSFE